MKIACVGYMHGKGGAERQLLMLANALSERGNEVYLIALADCNILYDVSPNVQVIDLSDSKNVIPNLLKRYLRLHKTFKSIKPDISIHFWIATVFLTFFIKKKIRGKMVFAERTDPGDQCYSGWIGVLRKRIFPKLDGFVFQTPYARDYFDEGIQKKSIVIGNSIKIKEECYSKPCTQREKKIVSVGRLADTKNQKLLIDAFGDFHKKFPDYKLEIYGEGPLRQKLQEQINNLQIEDYAFLCGNTDEIFKELYTATMFVLTSEFEGMPNALIEAMALGVPCVSTDCRPGGARMLIDNGRSGFITGLFDREELVDKMSYIVENPVRAAEMAELGMNIRNTNNSDVIYDKWVIFLEQVL